MSQHFVALPVGEFVLRFDFATPTNSSSVWRPHALPDRERSQPGLGSSHLPPFHQEQHDCHGNLNRTE